ncbi:MAG: hypothetical protein IKW30_10450 [Lachnospiraceae bacterium]|nr:hypothetical protein [Lachnospiraceae bacterium]
MLGIVLLWIVVYLSGTLICKIAGEKETSQLWKHLIGFFFLILCQGTVFFLGQLAGWSHQNAGWMLVVMFVVTSIISLLICKKELIDLVKKIRKFSIKEIRYGRYLALFFWIFLALMYVIISGSAGNRSDAMVETVQTTLLTDTMNQYHPFTRQPMEMGMILSKKLITLPFWYAILSVWTGFDGVSVVWILGSLITLIVSFLAFAELGGLLFFRDFKKTWLLLVLMELLFLSGDYYVGAAGYRQLFYGYSGEVMVGTITIPCVLCLLYRFLGPILRKDFPVEKEKMKLWGLVLEGGLMALGTLFVTSLAWGIVMVVLSVVLFAISSVGVRLTKRTNGKGEIGI